jgi:hypothetical protein
MDDQEKSAIVCFVHAFEHLGDEDLGTLYEPVSENGIGKALFQMGIGRPARREVYDLVHAFMEDNPCLLASEVGGYTRANHLRSIPLSDKASVSERAREIFSRIPKGIARTVIERFLEIMKKADACSVLVGLSDEDKEARSVYYPVISYVETAACDRACGHCSTLANPRLPNVSFDDITRGFGKLPPSPLGVSFTYGEPFRWNDGSGGRRLNIGDALRHVLERFPDVRFLALVTSGINFKDRLEAEAADTISRLPESMRQRIHISVTLSDYPHFERGSVKRERAFRKAQMDDVRRKLRSGEISAAAPLDLSKLGQPNEEDAKRIEAARQAQVGAIRFAIENGLRVRMNSFLDLGRYADEVARPLCSELVRGMDVSQVRAFGHDWMTYRVTSWIGRAALERGSYFVDTMIEKEMSQCFAYSGVMLPPRADIDAVLAGNLRVPLNLTLSPGGFLAPGCCMPPSQHAVISDIRKPVEGISEDAVAFMRRIRRMKADGKLTCMGCIGEADYVRDPVRFRKTVGPKNAALIPAGKLRIR